LLIISRHQVLLLIVQLSCIMLMQPSLLLQLLQSVQRLLTLDQVSICSSTTTAGSQVKLCHHTV
jgi:hypothetical protein